MWNLEGKKHESRMETIWKRKRIEERGNKRR
jgi:hypothetical protein